MNEIALGWLFPLLLSIALIFPLIRIEYWIHKHIQGLGLLITDNSQAAVLIYYFSLFPGVLLHEVSQWILAQILRVKVKKFQIWPEEQKGGVIRLGLVEIEDTDIFRSTLIGIIPLVSGLFLIGLIGNSRFELAPLAQAFAGGDLPIIVGAIGTFMAAPDFWLWVYLIFAIANAMLPEEHDEINWWILVGFVVAAVAFLLVLDLGILVQAWLEGPFTITVEWIAIALLLSYLIDIFFKLLIIGLEWLLSEILGRELEYG